MADPKAFVTLRRATPDRQAVAERVVTYYRQQGWIKQ